MQKKSLDVLTHNIHRIYILCVDKIRYIKLVTVGTIK